MQKFKDKYIIRYERDHNGKVWNKEDNFIRNSNGRYLIRRIDSATLLACLIPKKEGRFQTVKNLYSAISYWVKTWDEYMDDEAIYFNFNEKDLDEVCGLLKIKRRKNVND